MRFEDNQLNGEPALRSQRHAGAFLSVADLQMSIQEKRIYMSKLREQIHELQEKIDSKSLPDEQEAQFKQQIKQYGRMLTLKQAEMECEEYILKDEFAKAVLNVIGKQ